MMSGHQGYDLLNDSIRLAIDFRSSIKRLKKQVNAWYFDVWQPNLPKAMYHAFDILPTMVITPHQAYQKLIRQEIELVPLEHFKGKTSAVMILPYPPGVPLIMPGEMITDESETILDFLLMLDDIGRALPGFETAVHGVEMDEDRKMFVQVIIPEKVNEK